MRLIKVKNQIEVHDIDDRVVVKNSLLARRHGEQLPNTIRAIIAGPSNCGKTNVMLSLLFDPNGLKFENVYVYSKSLYQPKYKFLEHILNAVKGVRYFPYKENDEVIEPNKALPNSVFIFDDVSLSNQKIIQQFYSMGRHNSVDSFYLAQSYSKVPKQLIRDNVNLMILFKQDACNLKHVFLNHVDPDMRFEDFHSMSRVVMEKPTKRLHPKRTLKTKKSDKLNSDIIHLSDAIRRKYLAIKVGKEGQEKELERINKPIVKPLDTLIETLKKHPKTEQTETKDVKPLPLKTEPLNQNKTQPTISPLQASDEIFTYEPEYFLSSTDERKQEEPMKISHESTNEYLEQYHELPRKYIHGLLTGKEDFHDPTFGIVHDPVVESWSIGNSNVTFDANGDIIIDTTKKKYKGTAGLYELLFKKIPMEYSENDMNKYQEILNDTNAHKRNNDPNEQIKGNKSFKYRNIIKRMIDSQGGDSTPRTSRKRTKSTATAISSRIGFGHSSSSLNLIAGDTRPYQYVYFDDINELVDRLRLLVSSQQAGFHMGITNDGDVNGENKRICNVSNPLNENDVATKDYVDKLARKVNYRLKSEISRCNNVFRIYDNGFRDLNKATDFLNEEIVKINELTEKHNQLKLDMGKTISNLTNTLKQNLKDSEISIQEYIKDKQDDKMLDVISKISDVAYELKNISNTTNELKLRMEKSFSLIATELNLIIYIN
ncbi:putative leucine-rich repeat-containing protein DDB_G0290503 [Onthophagus taurus]|uniref:putative leucine-rich repeat-containing protein DDB_G0290503 n=1 Tax=Onthophagus taurus TaxID=166361 RepID=UPI0039BE49AF